MFLSTLPPSPHTHTSGKNRIGHGHRTCGGGGNGNTSTRPELLTPVVVLPLSSQMGSSQPAEEPDEPLRLLGSHEFLRSESNESVENRRHAVESLRPTTPAADSRRNTTPVPDGGVDDSESRRGELTESRRGDDADESRRNDDGNADGWWHNDSRPGEPNTMESRRRILATGMEAGTESRRGTAATPPPPPPPRW